MGEFLGASAARWLWLCLRCDCFLFINDARSLDSSISKESEDDVFSVFYPTSESKMFGEYFSKIPKKKIKDLSQNLETFGLFACFSSLFGASFGTNFQVPEVFCTLCVSAKEVVFSISRSHLQIELRITLQETNSSHLKIDGWKTILSFWGPGLFSGANC